MKPKQVRLNNRRKSPATQARRQTGGTHPLGPTAPGSSPAESPITLVFINRDGEDLGGCELTAQEWALLQSAARVRGCKVDDLLIKGMDQMLDSIKPPGEYARMNAHAGVAMKAAVLRALVTVSRSMLKAAWARFDPSDDGQRNSGYLELTDEVLRQLEQGVAASELDRVGDHTPWLQGAARRAAAGVWMSAQLLIDHCGGAEGDTNGGLGFALCDASRGLLAAVAELAKVEALERGAA